MNNNTVWLEEVKSAVHWVTLTLYFVDFKTAIEIHLPSLSHTIIILWCQALIHTCRLVQMTKLFPFIRVFPCNWCLVWLFFEVSSNASLTGQARARAVQYLAFGGKWRFSFLPWLLIIAAISCYKKQRNQTRHKDQHIIRFKPHTLWVCSQTSY